MANQVTVDKNFNSEFEILIKRTTSNGYELMTPIVEDGVKITPIFFYGNWGLVVGLSKLYS